MNKEERKNYNKRWNEIHHKYSKTYYQKNIKKIKARQKKYYQAHKKQILEQQKQYYQKHNYQKHKFKNNYLKKKETPQWQELHKKRLLQRKISDRLRQRINKALIRQSSTKAKKTLFLLGCTIEEFIKWLEKQFIKGMSWANYGLWEIDHIKPCITFNLTKNSEQKLCFNYTNLRPLWAKDNKSRKKELDKNKEHCDMLKITIGGRKWQTKNKTKNFKLKLKSLKPRLQTLKVI